MRVFYPALQPRQDQLEIAVATYPRGLSLPTGVTGYQRLGGHLQMQPCKKKAAKQTA
jgi:hypothetical protein